MMRVCILFFAKACGDDLVGVGMGHWDVSNLEHPLNLLNEILFEDIQSN